MNKVIFKSQGALLIEVLLAIMILSVVLTVVMGSFANSLRASVLTADYSTALSLLEDKMAEVKLEKSLESLSSKGFFSEPYDKFSYDFKVNDFGLAEASKTLQEVDLAVSWTQGRKNNQINVVTLVFNPPQK